MKFLLHSEHLPPGRNLELSEIFDVSRGDLLIGLRRKFKRIPKFHSKMKEKRPPGRNLGGRFFTQKSGAKGLFRVYPSGSKRLKSAKKWGIKWEGKQNLDAKRLGRSKLDLGKDPS